MPSVLRASVRLVPCLLVAVCLLVDGSRLTAAHGAGQAPERISEAVVPAFPCGFETRTIAATSGGAIGDLATRTTTFRVTGVGTWLWDVDLVTGIEHTRPGDLVIELVAPDGTVVVISRRRGGSTVNAFDGTVWDDQADTPLTDYDDWTSGSTVTTVAPQQALASLQGKNPNGLWTLRISDEAVGETGMLQPSSLRITALPQPPATTVTAAETAAFATAISNPGTLTRPLDVSVPGMAFISKVTLQTNIEHTYVGDLSVVLTSPSGSAVSITTKNGGAADDTFAGTTWTDTADPLTLSPGLLSGVVYSPLGPEQPLASLNGENPNGQWRLSVNDAVDRGGLVPNSGELVQWGLIIETATCNYVPHTLETAPNHTPAQATPLTLVSGVAGVGIGSVYAADDVDYWSFTAAAGAKAWVVVDTGGGQQNGATSRDSALRLLAPDGTTVVEADLDDGVGNGADNIIETTAASTIAGRTLPEAGTYYLRVEAQTPGQTVDPYRVYAIVSTAPAFPLSAGPVYFSPPALVSPNHAFGYRSGSITASHADDVFAIEDAPAGALLVVSVDANPSRSASETLDAQIRFDDDEDFTADVLFAVESSPAAQNSAESFVYRIVTPGTYYVRVHGTAGSTGDYEIMAALLASPAADVQVTSSAPPPSIIAGTERTTTYAVSNAGPAVSGSLQLEYKFSLFETFVSIAPSAGWTCPPPVAGATATTGTCSRATPLAGVPGTFELRTRVLPSAGGQVLMSTGMVGALTPPATWFDLNPHNNWMSSSATATSVADLAVTASGPSTAPVGSNVTYSVLGKNGGPSDTANLVVTVTLPASTLYVGMTDAGMTCATPAAGASGTITCTAPGASASSSATLTVTVAAADPQPGASVGIQVSVGAVTPDPTPGNNASTATTVLTQVTAADVDGDGLPNEFEGSLGLDPTRPGGEDGPFGDPDGDGRTNLQELRDGTHPRGFFSQYFAEGSTGAFFDERLAVFNVDATATAHVLLRYLTPGGTPLTAVQPLAPLTRQTIDLETMAAGLASSAVSVVVECDVACVANRLMRWDAEGYGSHAETGVSGPSTTWYLAEGSTLASFNLFYLLQNPSTSDAVVTVTYLLPAPTAPVVKQYTVPANSRQNIWVNLEGPEFVHTDVSAAISSTVPIIVERAMYLDTQGQMYGAGHDSMGVTAPALSWFLAEGATGDFFDLFILLANPGAADAVVEARYLKPDGSTVTRAYTVAAQSRYTVWVDQDPALASTAVSTMVTSTNGVPIIVERAMWWPRTFDQWYEAHNSAGATETGTLWAVAGVEVNGPYADSTYLLIANTSDTPAEVVVTRYAAGGPTTETVTLPAHSRTNVVFEDPARSASDVTSGALVESVGAAPAEIVVEVALYRTVNGVQWAAGTNSLATRLR